MKHNGERLGRERFDDATTRTAPEAYRYDVTRSLSETISVGYRLAIDFGPMNDEGCAKKTSVRSRPPYVRLTGDSGGTTALPKNFRHANAPSAMTTRATLTAITASKCFRAHSSAAPATPSSRIDLQWTIAVMA